MFTVVGLVNPPLGGQGVDVYLPLAQLQKLSDQKNLVNVVLVRADDSDSVAAVEKSIQTAYAQAEVASAKEVAGTISGSLVDAANLSHSLGLALSIVAAVGAFLLAALLALSSVGKRVRELGTLKALGWTQRKVVRQIAGESLARACSAVSWASYSASVSPSSSASSGQRSLPARQPALEALRRRAGRPHRHQMRSRSRLRSESRFCSPASRSPSSAASSPARPAPSGRRAFAPPMP